MRIQEEQQQLGPTLRVSSAAEHKLLGSRSVSFAAFSEARQSGNVFYPRTLRGDTPPSDDQEEPVRAVPRSSSLNALSDVAALQAADNIIKMPPPRMNRVLRGVRSALSLSLNRTGRWSEVFQIQRKSKGSGIPRPVRYPAAAATQAEAERELERLRGQIERPVARFRRPGLMPSIHQVRVALNAVGRKLVMADSVELRKQWFRVSLPSLYIQFYYVNEPKLTCK